MKLEMSKLNYYYLEWKMAEKSGNAKLATTYKKSYTEMVKAELNKEPSRYYVDKLKSLPTIYLN